MKHRKILVILLVALMIWPLTTLPSSAQEYDALEECWEGAFSTEEDFMSEVETYDGNRYISDGDLLGFYGQLCVRNAALLINFDIPPDEQYDLGLDAIDILSFDERLVAFSTEIDSPYSNFTAGDLLFTTGGMIPNSALVFGFETCREDMGLDAVFFVGESDVIVEFAMNIDYIDPNAAGQLQEMLTEYNIDIWFSIEGTCHQGELGEAPYLDGDLLSARYGTIVYQQSILLDPPVPAGIPRRGVDFGLDAFAIEWRDLDVATVKEIVEAGERRPGYFSTEILYDGDEYHFTDGDLLMVGGNSVRANYELIHPFEPPRPADFLGLDAIWLPEGWEP